jgi:hypothetical protein
MRKKASKDQNKGTVCVKASKDQNKGTVCPAIRQNSEEKVRGKGQDEVRSAENG